MDFRSSEVAAGGRFPTALMAADCGGRNVSPSLDWTGAPNGARSFALIVHDADAPIPGGFYHWVAYNIPGSTRSLAAGAKLAAGQLGASSLGKTEYYGPCPPPGPAHHYTITLYALDIPHIDAGAPLTGAQLQARMDGHVLARATLSATAAHP